MTLEQKIGFVMVGGSWRAILKDQEDLDYVLSLIKKRALGAVWVSCHPGENREYAKTIQILREAADYPLLILTDEESGFGDYMIGNPISLGYVNDEKTAYAYGKAIAIESRKCGYSIVCNPLLDRPQGNCPCGGVLRTLHPDKETSVKLAEAMCRGMHDGGVLNCAKHYPSAPGIPVDSHISESYSLLDKDTIINEYLYPYKYLNDRGLLDCIMVGHKRYIKVDEPNPASVSAKCIDMMRDLGFEGIFVTDALEMMGIIARYGSEAPKWMCVEAGVDLSLGFSEKTKFTYDAIMKGYKEGKLSEERLNAAVKRVLAYQHKAYELAEKCKDAELSAEEEKLVKDINKHSIAAICDEGRQATVSRDGRHLFVFLSSGNIDLSKPIENDTMSVSWYRPELIAERIRKYFKNSEIDSINEYPTPQQLSAICRKRLEYDDVVIVTYFENAPYLGREAFTPRIESLFEAWQMSNAITAAVHLGNPFLIEQLPHIPLIVNACKSTECSLYAIDVLAGELKPEGKIPYKLNLK